MKNNWQTRKLGDVISFTRGLTYSKNDEVDSPGTAVLRANNIDLETNSLDLSEIRYIRDDIDIPSEKKVQRNSLIITTASGSQTHLGKVALIDKDYDFAFGGFMGQITPAKELDSKYLFYVLTSNFYREYILSFSKGMNINNLKSEQIKNYEFPVPQLNEQKRIVNILDEVFEKIEKAKENTEKNLQNSRELFGSYLEDIFSNPSKKWKRTTIRNEIELLVGFAFKSQGYTDSPDGIRLLRGDNIVQGGLRWDGVKRWKASEYSEYSMYALKEGDLVLAMDRPWVKAGLKYSMISKFDLPSLLVQRTACLRSGKNLENPFLKYVISSRKFIQHILGVQTGIGVPHISGGQIKNFEFSLPPLAEQRAIVVRLEALSVETKRLEQIYQSKMEGLEELKKSVLNEAFSGRL